MDKETENDGVRELTEAERELYDRQIRLWGLESQKRLRTAKVLIAGVNGLGAEVTKNLILAGVNSVKLLDDKVVSEADFCSQFLVARKSLGENRAEASIERSRVLNPGVNISADTESLLKKDAEYFKQFDVVVICGEQNSELLRIDNICREVGVKFFAGDVWGMFGFFFTDLQEHPFIEDIVKYKVVSEPNEKTKTEAVTTTVKRELTFPPYSSFLEFDIGNSAYQKKIKRTGPALIVLKVLQKFRETYNRDPNYKERNSDIMKLQQMYKDITDVPLSDAYFENVFAQISPAVAVVGGVLAQEIIKVVSKKEAPHRNTFLFDPETCCGFIEAIGID